MSDGANADTGTAGDTNATAADSSEAAAVNVDSLSRTCASDRRTIEALPGAEFAVEDGEFVYIVGPSRRGETTLSRIIASLEDATSDAVALDGSPVTNPGTDHGMVFQEYGLFPWRTVSESVALGLEEQGVEELTRSERVTEMLKLVSLDGFADTYPRELSSGMKQHIGITRVLAVDPELFLMDEPFDAVGAQTRNMLHGELLDIWTETDKTVLFITHDVEEAVALADHVVVMTANPDRVHEIVSVDIDRPRERTENEFAAYVERIHGLIGE